MHYNSSQINRSQRQSDSFVDLKKFTIQYRSTIGIGVDLDFEMSGQE
jgi:hypothetical protein